MAVDERFVEEYRREGFVVVEDLLSAAEIETLRQRSHEVASGAVEGISADRRQVEPRVVAGDLQADDYVSSLRKMTHLAFADRVFLDHATNPKILSIVTALIGPDVKLYQDQLFMKPPRIGSRQGYHQDQPAGFHIDPAEPMVSCWCAIDAATIPNGCLWMLPGSHTLGPLSREQRHRYEERALAGELTAEVPVELRSGSCSFHHGLILHSSRANTTDRPRWGYATHYVSARCTYTGPAEKHDAILVHGSSHAGKI